MSFRMLIVTAALAAGTAASAHAQAAQQQTQQPSEAAEKRPTDMGNMRIELVLTDKADAKTVAEERLTFLLAHGHLGRLRRSLPGRMPFATRNFEVDVTPVAFGNRIRIQLAVRYTASGGPGSKEGEDVAVEFVENSTAFLESGKTAVVIEATGDPASRRVTVQATATILR